MTENLYMRMAESFPPSTSTFTWRVNFPLWHDLLVHSLLSFHPQKILIQSPTYLLQSCQLNSNQTDHCFKLV